MSCKLLLITLLVTFYPITTAFSDDAIFTGNGYSVIPIKSDDVQMVSEEINISGGYFVDVTMVFKNFGPEQTLQLGFPYSYWALYDPFLDQPKKGKILKEPGFRTWVDGKEVAVTRKVGVKNKLLHELSNGVVYTSNVHFKKNQQRIVRHTYHVGGRSNSDGTHEFIYILKTGALWKGVIEKIKINFQLRQCPIDEGFDITPGWHRVKKEKKGCILQWEYNNIKPAFDLKIGHTL